ncbi:MAG: hypothetical protein IPJ76_18240 [Flavobacteriales bacterium]|nr:MAG: hypothetical protein IPJ76_18240 [Flavobacteriales bacterium]
MNKVYAVDLGDSACSRVPFFSQPELADKYVILYGLDRCAHVRELHVEGLPAVGFEESPNYYFLRCHESRQLTRVFHSLRTRDTAYRPFVNYYEEASGSCDGILDLLASTVISGLVVWSGIKRINVEEGTIDRDGDIPFMAPVLVGQVEHTRLPSDSFLFRVLAKTKRDAMQLVRAAEALHYQTPATIL